MTHVEVVAAFWRPRVGSSHGMISATQQNNKARTTRNATGIQDMGFNSEPRKGDGTNKRWQQWKPASNSTKTSLQGTPWKPNKNAKEDTKNWQFLPNTSPYQMSLFLWRLHRQTSLTTIYTSSSTNTSPVMLRIFCYNHRRHNHNNPTVPHKNSTHGKETRPETSSRAGPQPHGVPNLSSPSKTNYAWETYGDPHPIHVIIFLLDKLFKLEALVDPYFLSNIYMF